MGQIRKHAPNDLPQKAECQHGVLFNGWTSDFHVHQPVLRLFPDYIHGHGESGNALLHLYQASSRASQMNRQAIAHTCAFQVCLRPKEPLETSANTSDTCDSKPHRNEVMRDCAKQQTSVHAAHSACRALRSVGEGPPAETRSKHEKNKTKKVET